MFTLKKIAAAVALTALAGGAHATLITGATGAIATDDAELFFVAYDPTTQHTLVKDLGYSYTYIAANAGNTSWFTAVNLGAQVTPGTGAGAFNFTDGLQWNLAVAIKNVSVLGNNNNGAFGTINLNTSNNPAQANLQGATTFNAARGVLSSVETKITGKAQSINTYFINAGYPNTGDNALIIEDDPTQNDSFTKAWGTNFNSGIGGINNSGTIGESLAFYHWYLQSGPNRVVSDQLDGLFTLSNSGVLSYAAAPSAVPVPAAAWLFGSALAALGIIPRRRKNSI
jgi:hypothetical protein